MNFADFKKAGHLPTLVAAFLYFDFSFMVWVTLGPLMVYIAEDLSLDVSEKFTLVAIPILAGALLRIPLGACADHFGARRTAIFAQTLVICAIAGAWLFGLSSPLQIQLFGVALGVAGASFAVALPQAGRWYPPRYQGVVMGLAGAGNMGVVLDALLVPHLAVAYGWRNALGFLLIPLLCSLAYYVIAARDAPEKPAAVSKAKYAKLLRDPDCWWFMFFYFITFGGFVGLANALPLYFTLQYGVSGVAAGAMAAIVVFFGSLFRPVGGHVADRMGGVSTLAILFGIVALSYFAVAFVPATASGPGSAAGLSMLDMPAMAWLSVLLFSCGVLTLGMGNGAVFQLIPQRFGREIGIMTGIVGCAGGVGGFFLAKTLGLAKAATGSFSIGFLFFALLAFGGLLALLFIKERWRATWAAAIEARV